MRSAVLNAPGTALTLNDVDTTELAPDEILVAIAGVGICHTDLAVIDGVLPLPTPLVLGHEGSGVVERVGSAVTSLRPGDRVVCSFDSCRSCAECGGGRPAYCTNFAPLNYAGSRADGTTALQLAGNPLHGSWFGQSSWGTHAVASSRNSVRVDPDLPLEILGPLGCGLLTGAGAVFNVQRPNPGQTYGVWGLGPVGLAAVMAAKATGCTTIVAVDPNPARREIAHDLGATHSYDATPDLAETIVAELGGLDFTLEAVGAGPVIRQALEALRSPGLCVTVGFRGMENEMTLNQGHLLQGRTLRGVIEGDADPHEFIPRLIELWRAGDFPFDRLIDTYPLAQINQAIGDFRAGKALKPILIP